IPRRSRHEAAKAHIGMPVRSPIPGADHYLSRPESVKGAYRRPFGQPLTEPGRLTVRRLSGDGEGAGTVSSAQARRDITGRVHRATGLDLDARLQCAAPRAGQDKADALIECAPGVYMSLDALHTASCWHNIPIYVGAESFERPENELGSSPMRESSSRASLGD